MTYDELKDLHAAATQARDLAHRAYEMALRNRKDDGDTKPAFEALLQTNRVRDRIRQAMVAAIVA